MEITYTKLIQEHINLLQKIAGIDNVLIDDDNLKKYGKDETEDLLFKPDVVVKPKNVSQISEIMKLANTKRL